MQFFKNKQIKEIIEYNNSVLTIYDNFNLPTLKKLLLIYFIYQGIYLLSIYRCIYSSMYVSIYYLSIYISIH